MMVKKCWQNKDVFGVKGGIRSSGRLFVVHVGSTQGFIKKTELVFKSGTTTGDYHGKVAKRTSLS